MIKSSILVGLISILISSISFINQLFLAKIFGASINMDIYLLATSIPMLYSGIVCAAFSYTLVPTLIRYQANVNQLKYFLTCSIIFITAISLFISICGYITAEYQVKILNSNLISFNRDYAIEISKISWVTSFISILIAFLSAVHNINRNFVLPCILSIFPILGSAILGYSLSLDYGIKVFALGLLFGSIISVIILFIPLINNFGFVKRGKLHYKEIIYYFLKMPIFIGAMLCFTIFQLIDSYWAPKIGIGNLAYMGYAQRILLSISGLIIVGPATVILPLLAKHATEGRLDNLLLDVIKAIKMIIVLIIPIALLMIIAPENIVSVILERGAFDENAKTIVAAIVSRMIIGMVSMICVVIIFKALFAKDDIKYAFLIGILFLALYFIMSGILSKKIGVLGIAYAYSISWGLTLLVSSLILWRSRLHILLSNENIIFLIKILILIALTLSLLILEKNLLVIINSSGINLYIEILLILTINLVLYCLIVTKVLKIQELNPMLKIILRRN